MRLTLLVTLLAIGLASHAPLARAGGGGRGAVQSGSKPPGRFRNPIKFMRAHQKFRKEHDLEPWTGREMRDSRKAFQAFQRTGVVPERLQPANQMKVKVSSAKKWANDLGPTARAAIASFRHHSTASEYNTRHVLTSYTGLVRNIEKTVGYGSKHGLKAPELRTAARKVHGELASYMSFLGRSGMPVGFRVMTGLVATPIAEDANRQAYSDAFKAHERLGEFIRTGRFPSDD